MEWSESGDTRDDDDGVRKAFAELVTEGVLVPTGEFRKAGNGEWQPVYIHRDFAGSEPPDLPPAA